MTPLITKAVSVTSVPLAVTVTALRADSQQIEATFKLVNSGQDFVTIYGCQLTIPDIATIPGEGLGEIPAGGTQTIKTVRFAGQLPPATVHLDIVLTSVYGLSRGTSVVIPIDLPR